MNKKEAIQTIRLLDECIDHVRRPEVMLAADVLRRTLLRLWEQGSCGPADGQALLQEAARLPEMCMSAELHPALPMKLYRVMYLLCAPELTREKPIVLQCREQAEKIRCLRRWGEQAPALFACWDAQIVREVQCLHADKLKMMETAFARFLAIGRARAAERMIRERSGRLQEIAELRAELSPDGIADAVVHCDAQAERIREKLFEFEAEISASGLFNPVRMMPPESREREVRWVSPAEYHETESCDG